MPTATSYPGVYVEELASSSHVITGVSTASTAFADFFPRGPVDQAVQITNFRDFERNYGGLSRKSEASYGLFQYFNNGGQTAWVVRIVAQDANSASLDVEVQTPTLDETVQQVTQAAGLAEAAAQAAAQAAQSIPEANVLVQAGKVVAQTLIAAAQTQIAAQAATTAGQKEGAAAATTAAQAAQSAAETLQGTLADAEKTTDSQGLTTKLSTVVEQASAAAEVADKAAKAAETAATAIPAKDPPDAQKAAATEAAGAAQTAAAAAVAAAKAAGEAQQAKPADETAQGLTDNLNTIATQTSAAAAQAQQAGAYAAQAGQELEIAIQQAGAVSGTVGTSAKLTAASAAQSAQAAADAAKVAQEAAEAAQTAGTDPLQPSAQVALQRAALAASVAAQAASTAALNAADASDAAQAVSDAAESVKLVISAANPGIWGNNVQVTLQPSLQILASKGKTPQFDLTLMEIQTVSGKKKPVTTETYRNLSLDEGSANYAPAVVNAASSLVQLDYLGEKIEGAFPQSVSSTFLSQGADGGLPRAEDLNNNLQPLLDAIAPEIFNILCLPGVANYSSGEAQTALTSAMTYCTAKRAFLLIDPPASADSVQKIMDWSASYRDAENFNGAIYFPRLLMPDPLQGYRPRNVGPSGTIAGIYSRTDTARGVWKAPAGIEAVVQGADLAAKLTDTDSGNLNPLGINALRSFPVYGNVVWGARTLAGADLIDSQWKYINVRRLADYIEESLFQSLKWVVFEPNDEATWSQIRLEANSFLAGLFAGGAFQGATPDQAFFVHCDSTTTTQTDIDSGILNILIGFAPVKPAEFVMLQIAQIAGQTQ